ncbi:MAG: ATP-binding protein, partial [Lachnospiraceae bacterium]|nr:ATP-binding protein [Lachnospiraceae bacterium]
VGMIEKSFKSVIKKHKRVLITIDEVIHNESMRIFASQFQIFVRQDLPIFLIMTGLYENIYELQNDPALTFLLRTPKIITEPLSILQITNQYRDIFELPDNEANKLAKMTKGYAFAFQALGVSYWDNKERGMTGVLEKYDALLDDFVYKKIWASLSGKEKEIILAFSDDVLKTKDVCEKTGISSSVFSQYREKLRVKGLLDTSSYGYVALKLPRLYEVVKMYI